MTVPRAVQAAGMVRAQIADGTLKPGSAAPSGAAIGRLTGFSPITCRKALRALIEDGTLVPGASPNARSRVAASDPDPDQPVARATRELSAALAARRYNAGLTQAGFAAVTGYSVTTVGHAETGRAWQSRRFWERADDVLSAGGELLRLYDARRAAALPPSGESAAPGPEPDPVCVLVIWRDGSATVVPWRLADFIVSELRADLLPLHDEQKTGNTGTGSRVPYLARMLDCTLGAAENAAAGPREHGKWRADERCP